VGYILDVITNKGNVIAYVSNPREIREHLPQDDILISHKIGSNERSLIYKNSGTFKIEKTDKKYGVYAGDICQICRRGILVDYGGCATCPECSAQLKCGL